MSDSATGTRRRALEVLLAIALIGLLLYRFGPELRSQAGLPARAPELELATVSGDTLRLADLRGSVLLVNFWASWCAPCRIEMPILQDVWEDYRARGFLVVGLYTDEGSIADLVGWYRRTGITYPLARATPAAVRGFGQGTVLPTSYLVDTAGGIVKRVEGVYPEASLRATLDRMLAPADTTDPTAEPAVTGSGAGADTGGSDER